MNSKKIQSSILGRTLENSGFNFKGVKDFDAVWNYYGGNYEIKLILNMSSGVTVFEFDDYSKKSMISGETAVEAVGNMVTFFNRKGEFDMSSMFEGIAASISGKIMTIEDSY